MKSWFVSGLMLLSVTSFAQSKLKKANAKPDTTVYTSVEVAPEFPGRLEKFGVYLAKTQIPASDNSEKIAGRVIFQMIIEKDGSLSHIKVVRSGGKAIDQAYIKRLRNSPKWKPGLMHGKPVRVAYSLPISINFASDE